MTATIVAAASGLLPSAVAVLRLSGPGAAQAAQALTVQPLPEPGRHALRRLRDPASGIALDDALVLRFAAPRSFTGEDVVELQLHGGRAVVSGVLQALLLGAVPVRLAQPGEFSRRAVLNGRMDLSAAEAVADLIAAETAGQRQQALAHLHGHLASQIQAWRERLLRLLAHAEADIDFVEDDLPDGLAQALRAPVQALAGEVGAALADGGRGERLRDGFTVVLLGRPNAGKSTLLNALAGRDAAIVSPIAGTTRDSIEVRLDLDGLPVTLVDTAGLRDGSGDAIEREGMSRARARAADADLTLLLVPAGEPIPADLAATIDSRSVLVRTKSDLSPAEGLCVAAPSGDGLAALLSTIAARLGGGYREAEPPLIVRARHRAALSEVQRNLLASLDAPVPELAAEDLRQALRALGSVVGAVDVEAVLDRIFSEFCIGK